LARDAQRGAAMHATSAFKITVCGIEELTQHCEARLTHVVSILDPAWPARRLRRALIVWSFASTT
jgi:hypothetical protein